jgi:hypothetical protein
MFVQKIFNKKLLFILDNLSSKIARIGQGKLIEVQREIRHVNASYKQST